MQLGPVLLWLQMMELLSALDLGPEPFPDESILGLGYIHLQVRQTFPADLLSCLGKENEFAPTIYWFYHLFISAPHNPSLLTKLSVEVTTTVKPLLVA